MPIRRKKDKNRQHIEQAGGRSQGRLSARVIHPRHAHTHLGINNFARLFGDIKEKLNNNRKDSAHGKFQQHLERKLKRGTRHHGLPCIKGSHGRRKHQCKTGFIERGEIAPSKQRIGQNKPRHPHNDIQKQRQAVPIKIHTDVISSNKPIAYSERVVIIQLPPTTRNSTTTTSFSVNAIVCS